MKTPQIDGNINAGKLVIRGKSLPEDAREFFEPFHNWLESFYQTSADQIMVDLDIEYYNTSTSNILLDMIKKLREVNENKPVIINWYYEEDDFEMQEIGEDFQSMVGDIVRLLPKQPSNVKDPFKPTEF